MLKWLMLVVITVALLILDTFFGDQLNLHNLFPWMVLFFALQTFVLFRIDQWAPKEWAAQITLIKIVIRMLSSFVVILVLIYSQKDTLILGVQFVILYLVFMIFEIVMALTNLRRN